jgi:hypothetical protein
MPPQCNCWGNIECGIVSWNSYAGDGVGSMVERGALAPMEPGGSPPGGLVIPFAGGPVCMLSTPHENGCALHLKIIHVSCALLGREGFLWREEILPPPRLTFAGGMT